MLFCLAQCRRSSGCAGAGTTPPTVVKVPCALDKVRRTKGKFAAAARNCIEMAFMDLSGASLFRRSRRCIESATRATCRSRVSIGIAWRWASFVLGAFLSVGAVSAAGAEVAPSSLMRQTIVFDIPPQPVARALLKFSAVTGVDVLLDARHAATNTKSFDVRGSMEERDALDTLLVGSGFVAREFGPDTVLVGTAAAGHEGARAAFSGREKVYFAMVQGKIETTLCAHAETVPGRYRLALTLWVGRSGRVVHFKRLDTTGEAVRDAAVDEAMRAIAFDQSPPAGMPQPLTLVMAPRDEGAGDTCRSAVRTQRDASTR